MVAAMIRYVRAFMTALRMTMRGETFKPRYPTLTNWTTRTVVLVDAALSASNANGLDLAARKALMLHIDRRDVSMESILGTVRHHAAAEYPYLLRRDPGHALLAIRASNLNDSYRIERLCEQTSGPVRTALEVLGQHLNAIPDEKPQEKH
jgi:hypothetical protein